MSHKSKERGCMPSPLPLIAELNNKYGIGNDTIIYRPWRDDKEIIKRNGKRPRAANGRFIKA